FLSAQNQLKANRYSQKTIKVQIVLAIISTFYDILREQHLIVLYKEQLTIMNHHLHLVRLQKQADIASPMDLYRAEIRRGDIEDNINSSLERLKDLANILKNMISLPLSLNLTVTASLEEKPLDTDLELAIQAALANRAELQRADLELQEAYRKQSIAENNLLPDLHLVTEYSYLKEGSNDLSDQQSERQNIWALRLEGSTDITNNNARAAVEQSRLAIQRKRIGYDNTVQSISAEIRSIINRLEKIRQRIRLRDEQITQAKGKLGLARIKFKYGEAGNFDLIEAQNQLQRAKSDHLSERTRYITEGYRFHGAQGTLLSQFE
ncbi:MAG: TolC family protein, partial [Desulfobulbaceae bacterium]|nr:TolC family protein [Desulfobulbaceae bacterium]